MRLGVRSQLLGISAAILALMLAVGVVALMNLSSVEGGGVDMYQKAFVPVTQLDAVPQAATDEGLLVNKGIVELGQTDKQAQIDLAIAADENAECHLLPPVRWARPQILVSSLTFGAGGGGRAVVDRRRSRAVCR